MPPELAAQVCSQLRLMGIKPSAILEPTCGRGAFLEGSAQHQQAHQNHAWNGIAHRGHKHQGFSGGGYLAAADPVAMVDDQDQNVAVDSPELGIRGAGKVVVSPSDHSPISFAIPTPLHVIPAQAGIH
ncbi:MAG: hypothetical protein TH68_02105 [Candidatus Synechococcus spongiarum 142]|uniref:Uncharacterized protein n=1 Tax=Candidatus Synechococcus spongiarum 142 TaxID=1608213 RepID=A0A6N3X209_9SYNE|nr:MAG: hypothetical protein TH68_02105 [Candidatus Synechococcus spongiarum 142]